MIISKEQNVMLQSVKRWFNRPDQIDHYINEVNSGPTKAESYLLSLLPYSGEILDIGCGAGRISLYLAEKGYKVTGLDVSEGLIHVARDAALKRNLVIDYLISDASVQLFSNSRFEAIIGFKWLCYIPSRQLRQRYLDQLYCMLKSGGLLLLTQNIVPEQYMDEAEDEYYCESPASQFTNLERGDTFPLGEGYVHWFTEKQLLEELHHTKFKIERFESDESYDGEDFIRLIALRK